MDTQIRVSTESRPWRRKFSCRSCRDTEPTTFQLRVWCCNHWAIPAPNITSRSQQQTDTTWSLMIDLWSQWPVPSTKHYLSLMGGKWTWWRILEADCECNGQKVTGGRVGEGKGGTVVLFCVHSCCALQSCKIMYLHSDLVVTPWKLTEYT